MMALALFTAIPAYADQLTYYAYPPPLRIGIDWRSPSSLAWTTIYNTYDPDDRYLHLHTLGHINFDLRCSPSTDLPNGAEFMIGQTNSDDDEMNSLIFNKGYGLGVMLSSFSGVWETQEQIQHDLPTRFATGMIAYMDLSISPSTCARVVRYLTEYQARGYDKIYGGLQARPRYGEGAGCSAFGASVLEIAGVLQPEWTEAWQQTVLMPKNLIGGPLTGNSVDLLDVLFGGGSWETDPDQAISVTFWNPQKTYEWIQVAWHGGARDFFGGGGYSPLQNDLAKGVHFDASAIPTPTDGFWLGKAASR